MRAGALVHVSWSGDQVARVPVEVGGGGGYQQSLLRGGWVPRSNPLPYKKTIFDRKGTPFLYFLLASIEK